jgi:hypothetical protein
MKKQNKITIVFLILSLGLTLISGCVIEQTNSSLQKESYKLEGSPTDKIVWGYKFSKNFHKENTLFLDYTNHEERIKLDIISNIEEEFVNEIISDKIVMFQSLFEKRRIGYPGQYTRYIECPKEYKPKYYEKNLDYGYLKYFIGFANSNFVAGACSDDLIRYKLVYGFIFCNNSKKIIEIHHFALLNQTNITDSFIKKIDCKIDENEN